MRHERNLIGRTAIAGLFVGLCALPLGAWSTGAAAADKYVLEEVDETPVEFGTGWYIRGGVSVDRFGVHRESVLTTGAIDRTDEVSTTFGFHAGLGRRLSPNLRVDATFDYHSKSETVFEGNIRGGCAGTQRTQVPALDPAAPPVYTYSPIAVPCLTESSDEFSSQDLMLNGYYDFNPVGRFTPYLGLGVGATRLDYSSRAGDIVCTPPTADIRCSNGDYGDAVTTTGVVDEGTSYHLAGSLTLGLSYAISKNLSADLSYQLTKTVESPMWGGSNGFDVVGADSFRHAAKVGLRYEIW